MGQDSSVLDGQPFGTSRTHCLLLDGVKVKGGFAVPGYTTKRGDPVWLPYILAVSASRSSCCEKPET